LCEDGQRRELETISRRPELINEYPSSRVFFNIAGGSLTLLSVQLPWVTVYGIYQVQVEAGGFYAVTFYWALAGGILSFMTRYGGAMTLVGILGLGAEPYISAGIDQPASGILLAVTGAIVTLAGVKWAVPRALIRGREVLGAILYSVGFLTILVLIVSSIFRGSFAESQFIIEIPLFLVGVLVTGLGLKLFFLPERRDASLNVLGTA
jgi:hypothetical protein